MKNKLLEKAITLFSSHGYESVTMQDIALSCNTDVSAIYNYFSSKDDILEAIYNYYVQMVFSEAPTPEQYIPILESGTAEDILNIFNFPLPEPVAFNFCVIKIVLSRRLSDERAKKVHQQCSWEQSQMYLREVLTKGVEIGRLSMGYEDIIVFGYFIHATREYSAAMATMIEDQAEWRGIETDMNEFLARMLTLNAPLKPLPESAPDTDISATLAEAIQSGSHAIGKYNHYASTLRRMGKNNLVGSINEIVANILGEVDELYTYAETGTQTECKEILRNIASSERKIRIDAQAKSVQVGADPSSKIFSQIAGLARQHELICLNNIEQIEQIEAGEKKVHG